MKDLPNLPPDQGATAHQRVRGAAHVSMTAGAQGARLQRLGQQGAAKAMLPRVYGTAPQVVFLNTAGGLTGGDRLCYDFSLEQGATAIATTQTAERAYASLAHSGPAHLDVSIRVGAGGHVSWLPQETILFDGAALARQTRIDLGEEATCLTCESVILGRAAMGETVRSLTFRDTRQITRNGRPILLDPVALSSRDLENRDGLATLGGARAFASVVLFSGQADQQLEPVRRLLKDAGNGVEAACSAWEGRLVVRILAGTGQAMRRVLAEVLTLLGGTLPRVWQM